LKEASQAVDAATDQVLTLQRELSMQKVTASRFSTSFVEYQDLTSDLESLEKLQRETEEQRLALEAKAAAGYPQIEVIEPAYAPRDPIRPHYLRDLGLTLLAGTAVGLSTLLTLLWLDAKANARRAPVPVTGVRIWGQEPPRGEQQTGLSRASDARAPIEPPVGKLSDASLRQLMGGEVEALWELADDAERQLIGLLLSGLRPNEIAGLAPDDFDLEGCSVRVKNDASERVIALASALCQLFAEADPLPAWAGSGSEHVQEILQRIPLLAMDAGVAHAQEVDAEALRHTYLVYLVRQGARLTELHRIAGPMGAAEVQRYAPYSPSGASRPLEQLTLAYPVLG
jgi:integrase